MSNQANNSPGAGDGKGAGMYSGGSLSGKSAAKPKSAEKLNDDASLASIVDTIEAIIIALIIALTFRAFVVEAFVIPTGSMAPTLLGAHFNVICPKCGYVFTRDAPVGQQYGINPDTGLPAVVKMDEHAELTNNRTIPAELQIHCPNCQYEIDPAELPQYLGTQLSYSSPTNANPIRFAWANNGDRILVLKYLYAVLEPQRFDVIVFKEPMAAQDNFIKRLIGLPGETVEIINGDIFVGPAHKLDATDRVIVRKPEYVQKNVWQLVYDNDFYPTDAGTPRKDNTTWTNPWMGEGASAGQWQVAGPVLRYADAGGGSIGFSVRKPYTYNMLGYNDDYHENPDDVPTPAARLMYCGDLHLETVWTPQKDGDSIAMTLGQIQNEYRARWSGKAGLELERFNPATHAFEGVAVEDVREAPPIEAGKAYKVSFDNVDHALRLYINDKLVMEHLVSWNAAQARAEYDEFEGRGNPPYESQKPEIRVEVGGACTLGHLKLFRDLYYAQTILLQSNRYQKDFFSGPGTATMGNPLTLGPDEFFAMGDNSRKSHDGRSWAQVYPALDDLGTRRGVVPRRYLLGKAFFVYWPAGFRITSNDDIKYLSDAPLVPNVGEMRLIK